MTFNEQYNIYFEKNCRRRGGHYKIELDMLAPFVFTHILIPENLLKPTDGNTFIREKIANKEYLLPFIDYATYSQQ